MHLFLVFPSLAELDPALPSPLVDSDLVPNLFVADFDPKPAADLPIFMQVDFDESPMPVFVDFPIPEAAGPIDYYCSFLFFENPRLLH